MIRFKVNKNNYKKDNSISLHYYMVLSFLLMFYGHNIIFDVLSSVSILVLFLINIKNDNFILSYFALIFFEPILELPILGGSLFRVYQFLFIIRILLDLIDNRKFSINKKNNINILAATIYLLLSLAYISGFESVISSFINISILIYIVSYKHKSNFEYILSKILAVVGIFSVLSGLYGLLFGEPLFFGYFLRYGATIGDPNYSALFYTLGFFALLGTNSLPSKLRRVLILILCFLLVTTVSISGILGTIMLYGLYIGIKKKSQGMLYGLLLVMAGFVFMNFKLDSENILYGFQFRINSFLNTSDLSQITSNRSYLLQNYYNHFRSLPITKQLFGGTNIISGEYRDLMVGYFKNVSHNSFIDMLYLTGICGTIIILSLFITMIIRLIIKYFNTKLDIYLSVAFLKITLLYYSLSISIFTFRYYYTFFVL